MACYERKAHTLWPANPGSNGTSLVPRMGKESLRVTSRIHLSILFLKTYYMTDSNPTGIIKITHSAIAKRELALPEMKGKLVE